MEIKREEPSHVLVVHTGVRSLFTWNIVISFFAYWHYIICDFSLQYTQYTFSNQVKLLVTHLTTRKTPENQGFPRF